MKKIFKKIRPLLQIVIILLLGYFIGRILWDHWDELKSFDWRINWFYMLLALIMHLLSFSILGIAWSKIISVICARKLDNKKVFRIFFISQIIRYIPGNIWSFIGLAVSNQEHLGIRKTQTFLAIFIEIALRMAVGALISVIVLFEVFHRFSGFYYAVLGITILAVVFTIFNQKILNRFLNWAFRKKGEQYVSEVKFENKTLLKLCGVFALHWLVFGVGLYFLILALGLKLSVYKAIGIDILSWTVGYLSLITPSGVGVREASMIILLSSYMNPAIATVVSLLARVLFILGELLNLGIVFLWSKREKNFH